MTKFCKTHIKERSLAELESFINTTKSDRSRELAMSTKAELEEAAHLREFNRLITSGEPLKAVAYVQKVSASEEMGKYRTLTVALQRFIEENPALMEEYHNTPPEEL